MIDEPVDEITLTSQCLSFLESHARSNDAESCAVVLGQIQETNNRVVAKTELIYIIPDVSHRATCGGVKSDVIP